MTAQTIIHDEEFKTGHDSLLCYTAEIYPPCNVTCTLSSFYRYPIIAMPILFIFCFLKTGILQYQGQVSNLAYCAVCQNNKN